MTIKFEDHIGLVHMQAKFGFAWAQGAGVAMDYEDMFQEASEAFLHAAAGFNPDAGVKFSAYYTKACFSQFRKTIGTMTGVKNLNPSQREEIAARKEENKRRRAAAKPELPDMNYGLRPAMFSHLSSQDEDAMSFEETLEAETQSPEAILEFRQQWRQATERLSPLAQLVVQWLRDPPPALLAEIRKQMAHADRRTEKKARSHSFRDGVSVNNVGRFLQLVADVPKGELMLVKAELDQLSRAMEA